MLTICPNCGAMIETTSIGREYTCIECGVRYKVSPLNTSISINTFPIYVIGFLLAFVAMAFILSFLDTSISIYALLGAVGLGVAILCTATACIIEHRQKWSLFYKATGRRRG